MTTTSLPARPVGNRATLALLVAAAVDRVAGARRTVGPGVEVATQYPGGRVIGIRLGTARIEVHIVVESRDITRVADRIHVDVRAVLDQAGDPRSVAIIVDDIDVVSVRTGP